MEFLSKLDFNPALISSMKGYCHCVWYRQWCKSDYRACDCYHWWFLGVGIRR